MANITVTGTIRNPANGSVAAGPVTFQLLGSGGRPQKVAWLQSSGAAVEDTSSVDLVAGVYSIVLPDNDDILPAGTRWQRTHHRSGPVELYVTATPSTQNEDDILSDPPGSLASAALDIHEADAAAHGNGRRLWLARKTDATFATASTTPVVVTGWNRSDTVPVGDWVIEAAAEAFADSATNGGTLSLWVDLPITAISRTSNVVTATIPTGHGILAGADVIADLTDNTFDGRFTVLSSPAPTATTVSWAQTAANDADGGTGTLSIRIGVAGTVRNAGALRPVAHMPDVWWAPTAGLAYTATPRLAASAGTVTLLSGPFFGSVSQAVMVAETR